MMETEKRNVEFLKRKKIVLPYSLPKVSKMRIAFSVVETLFSQQFKVP